TLSTMYALSKPKGAGRFGEDGSDEHHVAIFKPPSPARPANLSMKANRLVSSGDIQPTYRATSPPRGNFNKRVSTATDPLTAELLQMHQQQQEQNALKERATHAGLVPDPGPPPRTIYCRSRSDSTVSSISVNENKWIIADPSLNSSIKSFQEITFSAEDFEGVWMNADTPETQPSRGVSRSNHSDRRGAEQSEVMSGPELADDLSPLTPPKRQMTMRVAPREFTVFNPSMPSTGDVGDREQQQETEALGQTPVAKAENNHRISPFTSFEETHQTFQRLYPDMDELQAEAPKLQLELEDTEQQHATRPEPPIKMDELRIEGMSEDEMIRLAVEASKKEEDYRQRFMKATAMVETVEVEDPVVTHSLEQLMEMPRSQRSNEHRQVKPKGVQKVRNMLGLGRGIESITRSL
ncbi:MAG: hypothetical protein SGILL_003136, partial [Bacillariaceae sp.]